MVIIDLGTPRDYPQFESPKYPSSTEHDNTSFGSGEMDEPRHGVTKQPNFLQKLYEFLNLDPHPCPNIIYWAADSFQLVIAQPDRLVEEVLPKLFKHDKLASFGRQLDIYGFSRLYPGKQFKDANGNISNASVWAHPSLNRLSTSAEIQAIKRRAPPKLVRSRRLADGTIVRTRAGPGVIEKARELKEQMKMAKRKRMNSGDAGSVRDRVGSPAEMSIGARSSSLENDQHGFDVNQDEPGQDLGIERMIPTAPQRSLDPWSSLLTRSGHARMPNTPQTQQIFETAITQFSEIAESTGQDYTSYRSNQSWTSSPDFNFSFASPTQDSRKPSPSQFVPPSFNEENEIQVDRTQNFDLIGDQFPENQHVCPSSFNRFAIPSQSRLYTSCPASIHTSPALMPATMPQTPANWHTATSPGAKPHSRPVLKIDTSAAGQQQQVVVPFQQVIQDFPGKTSRIATPAALPPTSFPSSGNSYASWPNSAAPALGLSVINTTFNSSPTDLVPSTPGSSHFHPDLQYHPQGPYIPQVGPVMDSPSTSWPYHASPYDVPPSQATKGNHEFHNRRKGSETIQAKCQVHLCSPAQTTQVQDTWNHSTECKDHGCNNGNGTIDPKWVSPAGSIWSTPDLTRASTPTGSLPLPLPLPLPNAYPHSYPQSYNANVHYLDGDSNTVPCQSDSRQFVYPQSRQEVSKIVEDAEQPTHRQAQFADTNGDHQSVRFHHNHGNDAVVHHHHQQQQQQQQRVAAAASMAERQAGLPYTHFDPSDPRFLNLL
ncbi:hypothetical protein IAR55_005964 [Kwoniella newhampshirensis]|uniref:HSF-type DNA-binding domain-containing protein n=1 Tax=Kwoniella newhampshirensis TaxID=1651941 RepID=A0AAW0YVE5_9TREE